MWGETSRTTRGDRRRARRRRATLVWAVFHGFSCNTEEPKACDDCAMPDSQLGIEDHKGHVPVEGKYLFLLMCLYIVPQIHQYTIVYTIITIHETRIHTDRGGVLNIQESITRSKFNLCAMLIVPVRSGIRYTFSKQLRCIQCTEFTSLDDDGRQALWPGHTRKQLNTFGLGCMFSWIDILCPLTCLACQPLSLPQMTPKY